MKANGGFLGNETFILAHLYDRTWVGSHQSAMVDGKATSHDFPNRGRSSTIGPDLMTHDAFAHSKQQRVRLPKQTKRGPSSTLTKVPEWNAHLAGLVCQVILDPGARKDDEANR